MDQSQTPESTLSPGKWIALLVAAVILAEGIWGVLVSLTNNLFIPLMARVMEEEPQSPLYLGKGDLNFPALFSSALGLCLAGLVFVVLQQWARRKPAPVRMKMVRVTKKVSQSTAGPLSITAAEPVVAPVQAAATPPPAQPAPTPQNSPAPVSAAAAPQSKPAPPAAPVKPAKPQPPKEVYYNIVGEPINPTEDD